MQKSVRVTVPPDGVDAMAARRLLPLTTGLASHAAGSAWTGAARVSEAAPARPTAVRNRIHRNALRAAIGPLVPLAQSWTSVREEWVTGRRSAVPVPHCPVGEFTRAAPGAATVRPTGR